MIPLSTMRRCDFTCDLAYNLFMMFLTELNLHGLVYWKDGEYDKLKVKVYYETISHARDEDEVMAFMNDPSVCELMDGALP